jgi:large subunit ribosomal protein L20
MRVSAGPLTRRRHKRLLKKTKGYRHGLKNLYKRAAEKTMKAQVHAFRGRKQKKRDYRSLWIVRINAAIRLLDPNYSYSRFTHGLRQAGIELNRKMLADIAFHDMETFSKILETAKAAV